MELSTVNKLVTMIVVFLSASAMPVSLSAENTPTNAETAVAAVLAEGLKVMAENGWGAADVADAIKSIRGLYVRDNATQDGRKRWNGKIVSTTVDTNTMTRTTVYENGRVFVDKAVVNTAAASVRSSNARLRKVVSKGVPTALARARSRRAKEIDQGVTNVTVTVTAGGKR